MSRANGIRLLVAVLAVGFFAAPIAARVVGVEAEQFENRRFAEAPRLSQGWDAFQQATRFLVDRMPLRAQAVRTNTTIWADVFGSDPRYGGETALAADQALPFAGAIEDDDRNVRVNEDGGALQGPATAKTGREGWLYLSEEFEQACDDTVSNELVLQRWGRLIQGFRNAGYPTELFVAPYKASVYPEHLAAEYPYDHCALKEKERFWRLLAREGPGLGIRELRSPLVRLKANAGDGLFMRTDTHWTTLGALVMVDAALDSLGEGVELEPSEIVDRGPVRYRGNLSQAGASSESAVRDEYGIERHPDAPRVPGRTLLICDSFAYLWMRLFRPYFEDVRYISWVEDEHKIARAIRRSDTVILEATEVLMKVQARDGEKALSVPRALAEGRG
jgi:hypothetical protein